MTVDLVSTQDSLAGWLGDVCNSAATLAHALLERKEKIVLAESCTAGLVSAMLAQTAGVSSVLCGSWATYRNESKRDWLGVPAETIEQHSAVSLETSRHMARLALERTPEATWSVAITGHLGPGAPTELDGCVFVSIWQRDRETLAGVHDGQFKLPNSERSIRQFQAAFECLQATLKVVRG